jgi:hypothetical protein
LSSEEDRISEEFFKRLYQVGIEHIYRVTKYSKILSNRLLEQTKCQEGLIILHLQDKERRICFLRSLGEKRISRRIELCVRRGPAEVQELKNPLRIRKKDKLRRVSAFDAESVTTRSVGTIE